MVARIGHRLRRAAAAGAAVTESSSVAEPEVEDLLRRLAEAHQSLVEALKGADPERFAKRDGADSVKALAERTSDDVNFYYGRLAARAMSMAQQPCLQRADFSSLREAVAVIIVGHCRFADLLHDLSN